MAFKERLHPRDKRGRFRPTKATVRGTKLIAAGRNAAGQRSRKLLSKQSGSTTRITSANVRSALRNVARQDKGLPFAPRRGKKLGPGVTRRGSTITEFRRVLRPVTVSRKRRLR